VIGLFKTELIKPGGPWRRSSWKGFNAATRAECEFDRLSEREGRRHGREPPSSEDRRPSVITVFDVVVDDGQPVVVLELVPRATTPR
jgi:hypothetical protein